MKKPLYLGFLIFLLSCNNQKALKETLTSMSNDWDKITLQFADLTAKIGNLQGQLIEKSKQMDFKEAWAVQLKEVEIAQLKDQINIVEVEKTTLAQLSEALDKFQTEWETETITFKKLNSIVKNSIALPANANVKVPALQTLLVGSQEKITNWTKSLAAMETKSEAASAKFSKLVIDLDPNIIACNGTPFDVVKFINEYAAKIEAEPAKWIYSTTPSDFKDCSGMFLRLCEEIQKKNCEGYDFPDRSYHDTRTLSGWFNKRGNLTLTRKPEHNSNLIRPGTVMFYGYENRVIPSNYTAEMLAAPYPKGLIKHIGVVTDVTLDANGKVTSYEIYHGSRKPNPARRPTIRAGQTPVYSNWGQPLLAVGHIMTVSKV